MELYKIIKPLGITTYVLLFLTIVSGMLRWKLNYHKRLAITTLLVASIHTLIVILSH